MEAWREALLRCFFGDMASNDDSLTSTKSASTTFTTTDVLPQFPGEDFLAHAGALHKEKLDARLGDLGLMPVALGFEPESIQGLKDYDLSVIPILPDSHPQYYRNQIERMKLQTHNEANAEKRQKATLKGLDVVVFEAVNLDRSYGTLLAPTASR